ncbi:MAG: hypothetical protein D6689_19545 [Deltaproteobacteria bacterium]|nr:MAG: hypothetical protein D6689_19545 [Deltaproteobacteria bacterium]
MRRRTVALAVVAGAVAASPAVATAAPRARPFAGGTTDSAESALRGLGGYEREAVDRVLRALAARVDPAPGGKRIRTVRVVNLDVFGPSDGPLRWLDALHRTSRPEAVRREVLLRPGDVWNAERAAESERRLRDPLRTSLAVVLPLATDSGGTVDVLVVTWDVWSLRLNSDFEVQDGALTSLLLRPAESNFLGLRKQVGALFEMDQGQFTAGPVYADPNLAGTHITLDLEFGASFSRATSQFEGTVASLAIGSPLWSLDRQWGWRVVARRANTVQRTFAGDDLARYDAPSTPEDDRLPRAFRLATIDIDAVALHRSGAAYKHDIEFGHQLRAASPKLLDGFAASPEARDDFIRDILPEDEVTSSLVGRYRLSEARFVELYDVRSYDLAEDLQLGPDLAAEIAVGLRPIGSDRGFVRIGASAGWTERLGADGYARARASVAQRRTASGVVDRDYRAAAEVITPSAWRRVRAVLRADARAIRDSTRGEFLAAGGDTGLRGYPVAAFEGDTRAVVTVELRTLHWRLGFARVGGTVFWDAGGAATRPDRVTAFPVHHDVGIGARIVAPQTGPDALRIDWAVPLDGGLPGRLSLGFGEVF